MAQPCSQALSKLMDHWIWLLSFVFLPFLLPYSPLEMGQGMSRNQNKQNLPKFKLMHPYGATNQYWCVFSIAHPICPHCLLARQKEMLLWREECGCILCVIYLLYQIEAIKRRHSRRQKRGFQAESHKGNHCGLHIFFLWLWFQTDWFHGFDITSGFYVSTSERGKTERLWRGMWTLESKQHVF